MWVSLALLAPIMAVLYWIYIRTGEHRPGPGDYLLLLLIAVLMTAGTVMTHWLVDSSDGSLWVYVLAPMVGYGLLLAGWGLAIWLRYRR